jgi:hypothetical protein
MPKFTTVFRATVMFVAAVMLVKGWQICGPSTIWLKSVAAQALELTQDSLIEPQAVEESRSAAPVSENPPAFADTPASLAAVGTTIASPPIFPTGDGDAAPAVLPQPIAPAEPAIGTSNGQSRIPESDVDRMPLLMNHLAKLGAANPQLAPWGSSRQLYRFCCSATLAKAPSFRRHFESVAMEPLTAVEEVVAKVEAWRTAEESGNQRK